MAQWLVIAVVSMAMIAIGMRPTQAAPLSLEEGRTYTLPLADGVKQLLLLQPGGDVEVTVWNHGRGSILSAETREGKFLARAANWRGPEHSYVLIIRADQPLVLTVEPDLPIGPPGKFQIRKRHIDSSAPTYNAELAMSRGADLHLEYYFENSDTREAALAQYMRAADLFADIGDHFRQADALFEAANVSDELGQKSLAIDQYREAELIWIGLGDQRGVASTENLRGLVYWSIGDTSAAIRLFESAADRRRQLGDDYFLAQALNNVGLVHRDLGDARTAAQYFQQALSRWQGSIDLLEVDPAEVDLASLDHPPWLADSLTALNNLGWAASLVADTVSAQKYWKRAIELSQHLKRQRTRAELQHNLGALMYTLGHLQGAYDNLNQALSYFSGPGKDESWSGLAHYNIARVHRAAGREQRAIDSLNHSLGLRTAERDPVGRAETLAELSDIALQQGNLQVGLRRIEDALHLFDMTDEGPIAEAMTYDLAARLTLADGRPDDAMDQHDRAVDLFSAAADLRGVVNSRTSRALTKLAQGRVTDAIDELEVAFGIAEGINAPLEQFRALSALGRAHLANDGPERAKYFATRAIELSEVLRQRLVHPVLLRDYAAVQRAPYETLVAAELALGQVEAAWLAADDSRAQHFTDLLRYPEFEFGALSNAQQARFIQLRRMIAAKADRRTELLAAMEKDKADLISVDLVPLLDEMEFLLSIARDQDRTTVNAASLNELQSGLGEGDVVLEYFISQSYAGVWIIRSNGLGYQAIANFEGLDHEVRKAVDALRNINSQATNEMSLLAQKLLSGALDAGDEHVIVVADGPLHVLSFAALPDPATDYRQPMIANRDISHLPSVAALLALRSREQEKSTGIAVIADPVFEADDPRILRRTGKLPVAQLALDDPDLLRAAERSGISGFPRLPATLAESRAIREAAGATEVLTLTGTDANRDTVLSGVLDRYRILHFATHGILDADEPALSGLILSSVTESGLPRRRFLRTQDIAGLSLGARLVVLSGCETALGRSVRGEGLLGISHAFFQAGAEQVVSSLWQVPDRATAELMDVFYSEILKNGRAPASALRVAQNSVRANRRWRDPFFWAAFVVQGDWK